MKKLMRLILILMFIVGMSQLSLAAEHGGKEHGGKEHEGMEAKVPSKDDIRNAMKTYVMEKAKETGTFDVFDPDTGEVRNLTLIRVHERVGKIGDYYYSCADFKDANSDEMLDLDLDVEDKEGKLGVVDVRIHKVDGQARYTYDDQDNRIPLKDTKSHKGSMKGSASEDKGSTQEHGGHEHGGKEHGGK